ncbi:hypothetical protein, partial [Vibrio coralliirubri]|uniref:hypothetical protein n=1 Tax=Vibrio coralliirubri TaxID=1516159 RepID=UPI001EE447C7
FAKSSRHALSKGGRDSNGEEVLTLTLSLARAGLFDVMKAMLIARTSIIFLYINCLYGEDIF